MCERSVFVTITSCPKPSTGRRCQQEAIRSILGFRGKDPESQVPLGYGRIEIFTKPLRICPVPSKLHPSVLFGIQLPSSFSQTTRIGPSTCRTSSFGQCWYSASRPTIGPPQNSQSTRTIRPHPLHLNSVRVKGRTLTGRVVLTSTSNT